MWAVAVYITLLLGCCGYALFRGGGPERAVAIIVLMGTIVSPLVAPPGTDFRHVSLKLFAVDLTDQLALLWVAMRADRLWPIAAAAVHWLSPVASLAKGLLAMVSPAVYVRTEQAAFWLVLVLLAIGTRRHRLRLKWCGNDASWSTSSPRSRPRTPSDGQAC